MRTHLMKEGKKSQFLFLETGDISLTSKDIESLSRVLGKISPFADPDDYTSEEDKIWLSILDGLARHESFKVVNELAINTSTPARHLVVIFERKNKFLLEPILNTSLAQNPSTPPHLLEAIYSSNKSTNDPNTLVKNNILSNPSTPFHILQDAYKNHDFGPLAKNPTSPEDWLILFYIRAASQGFSWSDGFRHEVLRSLSQNPSTPHDVLEELAFGEGWRIESRKGVAKNPSTPGDILRKLSEVTILSPFQQLALNPSTPLDILESFHTANRDEWQLILRNESMPPERLEYFYDNYISDKGNWDVLYNLSQNPSTPVHVLKAIFEKGDLNLNEKVLHNISAPASILTFNIDKSRVTPPGTIIAANPATPTDILHRYYHHAIQENDIAVLVALASNKRGLRTT